MIVQKADDVSKRKYWYKDKVIMCLWCGIEMHHRKRVYNETEKGTKWEGGYCLSHQY